MSTSNRLRLGDVRGVFHLIQEVVRLRDDSTASREHMVSGLCKLVGARQGAFLRWEGFTATGPLRLTDFTAGGHWSRPDAAVHWAELMARSNWRGDPILDGATRVPAVVGTRARQQFVRDQEWYKSEVVNAVVRPGEVDHPLVSWCRHEPRDRVSGISLQRAWGDRPFSPRERGILHLFSIELHRLFRTGELDAGGGPPTPTLSPRLAQVLQRLLAGDSVKQVARNLGLSYRTADGYVKDVYRKLDVHSRAELLARFINRPAPPRLSRGPLV